VSSPVPVRKGHYVDYQARGAAFRVGDHVYPIVGGNPATGGTVVAVWPAIGMVDVQFPHGATRYAVEELVIDRDSSVENLVDVMSDSVPGGTPTVSVPGGPNVLLKDVRDEDVEEDLFREASMSRKASSGRVIEAFIKKAIYWDSPGRKYRMTRSEMGSMCPSCPRCPGVELRKTIYKREDARNERLYACPDCLFMIRRDDIIGFGEV